MAEQREQPYDPYIPSGGPGGQGGNAGGNQRTAALQAVSNSSEIWKHFESSARGHP